MRIQEYQQAFTANLDLSGGCTPETAVNRTASWFARTGRQMYEESFRLETKQRIDKTFGDSWLVSEAYPKNWDDVSRKSFSTNFYRANATIFLKEMTSLLEREALLGLFKSWEQTHRLALALLVDSVALLGEWNERVGGMPEKLRVIRNQREHFYYAYRHALGYASGHPSSSVFPSIHLIRAAIELRIRWAFGVLGAKDSNGGFRPVGLDAVLEELQGRKSEITFAVPFDQIRRIYNWCNLYVHVGAKPYEWAPLFALRSLQSLFVHQETHFGRGRNLYAGIQTSRAVFEEIRASLVKQLTADGTGSLIEVPIQECQIVLVP